MQAGAPGNNWPSELTPHSKLVINKDPNNLSHLSLEDQCLIAELESQIKDLDS